MSVSIHLLELVEIFEKRHIKSINSSVKHDKHWIISKNLIVGLCEV